MTNQNESCVVTTRLPKKVVQELDRAAKLRRRSRSQLVQEAVAAYLTEASDYEMALERFRDKSDEVLTGDDLWAALGWK